MTELSTRIRSTQLSGEAAWRDRGARSRASGGGPRKNVAGRYDKLYLPENKNIWIHISQKALYTYEVYDRETGGIIEVTTPWFEHTNHFVASLKSIKGAAKSHICSAGVRRDKPCYSCGLRAYFYDQQRSREKKLGVRERAEAPVSASKVFAVPVTVMERFYKIPVLDKDSGKPRTNRSGEKIYNFQPESFMTLQERQRLSKVERPFGRNMWMPLGTEHLNMLLSFSDRLGCYCANCAEGLMINILACPECGENMELPDVIAGEDIVMMLNERFACEHCSYTGTFIVPLEAYACECEHPAPGGITTFDIQIRKVKVGENSSSLQLVNFRVPKIPEGTEGEAVIKLIEEPLNVMEICSPESLQFQNSLYEKTRYEPNPEYHFKKKAKSIPYESKIGEGDEAEEDETDSDDDESEDDDVPY